MNKFSVFLGVFIVLFLCLSVYAVEVSKSTLIMDKRTDYVNPIPGETFCVERNISAGSIVSPRWDGNLTLISIDAVSYSTETYNVNVPVMGECTGNEDYIDEKIRNQKDCEDNKCVWDGSDGLNVSCFCSREIKFSCQTGTKREERTRTIPVYTPIKSLVTSKNAKAVEVQDKLSSATKALSKEAYSTTATNGLTRFCFKAPTWEELRAGAKTAGEISYVAYTDTKYDVCESTWWNNTWTSRKPIVVNLATNMTDYQLRLGIDWFDGLDTQFRDIRFAAVNDTPLSYWVQNYTESVNATIWVKFLYLNTSNGTQGYMYYRGTNTTNSSGANTFIQYYDVNNVDGTWTNGTYTKVSKIANGWSAISSGSGDDAAYTTFSPINYDTDFWFKVKPNTGSGSSYIFAGLWPTAPISTTCMPDTSNTYFSVVGTSSSRASAYVNLLALDKTKYYIFRQSVKITSDRVDYYMYNSTMGYINGYTNSYAWTAGQNNWSRISFAPTTNGLDIDVNFEWAFISKYLPSENATYSFGTEENTTVVPVIPNITTVNIVEIGGKTNNSWQNSATPKIMFAVNGSNASYGCTLLINDTFAYGSNLSVTNNTNTNITINASLVDKNYTIIVNCTGNVTNSSGAWNFTVDTTAPTTSISINDSTGTAYSPSVLTNSTYLNVSFDCSDGSGIGCGTTLYCNSTTDGCTPNIVYSGKFQLTTAGKSYLRYKSNDTLGTNETVKNFTTNIDYPPVVTFIKMVPADLTSTNLFAGRANITYNITNNGSAMPILFYKTNTTTSDNRNVINGTITGGWGNVSFESVVDTNFSISVGDAKVYPVFENLDFQLYFRNIEHTSVNLTANSNRFIGSLYGVNASDAYNYFEIDLNSTTNASVVITVYNTSTNCSTLDSSVQLGIIANPNSFNHTHNLSVTIPSRHHVLPVVINTTTGKIGTLKVTPTMCFGVSGQNGRTISIWGVDNVTRADTMMKSTNNGASYVNQAWTADMHWHHFSTNDTFWFYTRVNSPTTYQTNSTLLGDTLDLGGLPPTAPEVTSPIEFGNYSSTITIAYTESQSATYTISFYNISLLNANDSTFNKTIYTNNSLNLSYVWTTTGTQDGTYIIGVTVKDNQSNTATGYSKNFTIDNTAPTTTATMNISNGSAYTNNTWTNSSYVNITLACSDSGVGCNKTLYCNDTLNTCTPTTEYTTTFNISTQGVSYLRYYSNDLTGNNDTLKGQTIKIDTLAPNTSISINTSTGANYTSNNWTNTEYLNITFTCLDGGSGCNTTLYCDNIVDGCTPNIVYNTKFNITTEGTTYLRYYSNDTLNNIETTKNYTIKIDRTKPTTNISINTSSGSAYSSNTWTNSTYLNITLTCGDGNGSGCDKTLYCNSTIDGCTPNVVYAGKFNITTEGTTYLRYYSNDTINNVEAVKNYTIKIDTISPTTTILLNTSSATTYTNNTWTNSSYINVSLTCSDIGSGCDKTLYCNDTINSCTPNVVYTTTFNISSEGTTYVRYRSNDTAGNLNTVNGVVLKMDRISPLTNISINTSSGSAYSSNTWTNSTYLNITLTCGDGNGSGCDKTLYCNSTIDGCTPNVVYAGKFNITTEGITYLRYYSNDTINNIETTKNYTIKIDTTAPTTTATMTKSNGITYVNNTWTNLSYVNISLSCNDGSGSGCDKIVYCNDTINTCTPTTVYTSVFNISAQNITYIRYRSNDTINNLEVIKGQTIKIDSVSPNTNISINTSSGTAYVSNTWTNSTYVNITFSCSDASSGCGTTLYCNSTTDGCTPNTVYTNKFNITTEGTTYLRYFSNDTINNTEAVQNYTIKIDTIIPTTTITLNTSSGTTYTNNTWSNASYINITFTCSDSGSGCDKTLYCNDTINACIPNIVYTATFNISTEGTTYVRYYSNDSAGNTNTVKGVVLKMDRIAPLTNISINTSSGSAYSSNTWTNSAYLNTTLTCGDGDGSGCNTTLYCDNIVDGCTPNIVYNTKFNITTEGTTYLRYYSNDTSNNIETTKNYTIKIDTTKPTTTATMTIVGGTPYTSNTWSNTTQIDIELSCSDGTGSGCDKTTYCNDTTNACTPTTTYTSTITITAQGITYLKFRSNDTAGNNETTQTVILKMDRTAPTTSISAITNTGAPYTSNTPTNSPYVNITLSCADTYSGCANTLYCNNAVDGCTPSTTYTGVFTVATPGTSYTYYKSTDAVGNIETPKNFTTRIDGTAPITTITVVDSYGNPYVEGVLSNSQYLNITFSCVDVGYGCDKTIYCLDTLDTCTPTTIYTTVFNVSTEGISYIRYYSNDTSGNNETISSFEMYIIYPLEILLSSNLTSTFVYPNQSLTLTVDTTFRYAKLYTLNLITYTNGYTTTITPITTYNSSASLLYSYTFIPSINTSFVGNTLSFRAYWNDSGTSEPVLSNQINISYINPPFSRADYPSTVLGLSSESFTSLIAIAVITITVFLLGGAGNARLSIVVAALEADFFVAYIGWLNIITGSVLLLINVLAVFSWLKRSR